MSKNIKKLSSVQKELTLTALYEGAKKLDGEYPAVDFINELLTESEKIKIGRRILIAQMILGGCYQTEIQRKLGVSPNTFTRTRKWLEGQIPEYGQALRDSNQSDEIQKRARKAAGKESKSHYNPATFTGMRKKYPLHFLFFNLAEELLVKLNK
jgi:Trp operon repressor